MLPQRASLSRVMAELQRCGILGSVLKDGEVAEGIILSHLGHHLGAADAAGDAVDLIVGAGDHGDIFQRGRDVTAADQLAVRLLIGSAEGQSRTGYTASSDVMRAKVPPKRVTL